MESAGMTRDRTDTRDGPLASEWNPTPRRCRIAVLVQVAQG